MARDSIAWDRLEPQVGDEPRPRFSFEDVENELEQIACHVTYTSQVTHALRDGQIESLVVAVEPQHLDDLSSQVKSSQVKSSPR